MGPPDHPQHDKGYKLVLSKESVFLELLNNFVAADWVQNIDPKSLTRLDKSYILPDFLEKEADLVYRATIKGEDVFFYVLLELQSTVDFQMPYRLLEYLNGIWRDVLKNSAPNEVTKKDYKLPNIVPLVLYNRPGKWTACGSFKERLHASELFGNYQVDFKYFLLQVSEYTKEQLLASCSLIGLIFFLDQTPNWELTLPRLSEIASVTEKFDQPTPTFELLTIWLWQMTPEEAKADVAEILKQANPKEAKKMYSNFTEAIRRKFEEALLVGETKGKYEGKLEDAQRMLDENLPEDLIMRITGLTQEQINELKAEHSERQ